MSVLQVFGPRPLEIERGEGCYLMDTAGRRYLDFISGIGVNALGYGDPAIVHAIQDQAARCLHTSNLHSHRYQRELAARLAQWSGLEQVFFSNSGAEAMEAALKCARALANRRGRTRHRIVALENGFHGRTTGALAVTGQAKYREPFAPLIPDVIFVPANDVDALLDAANENTIAIIAETIQGEGGIYPLNATFLQAIRDLSSARDALWIADETQCGLGRTGERFAYQAFGLTPDVVVTAKPLGGGLPLGATIFSGEAASAFGLGMHGSTFGGGPLACRVALAFLEQAEHLLPHICQVGHYLHARLREMAAHCSLIREVRGRGLMAGIELNVSGDPFVEQAREQGLILNCTHGNVLRLLPPFVITAAEVDQACDVLARILGGRHSPDRTRSRALAGP
ncbi:MAG: acetylornithine/succinylornithine family transaminase [Bryobacterales bacterium]|nr:acetylornithine/succinylornithine family transaminase [Bryobacterales bacterium]